MPPPHVPNGPSGTSGSTTSASTAKRHAGPEALVVDAGHERVQSRLLRQQQGRRGRQAAGERDAIRSRRARWPPAPPAPRLRSSRRRRRGWRRRSRRRRARRSRRSAGSPGRRRRASRASRRSRRSSPMQVKVRSPPKRAARPVAWADHWRSRPTAAPVSAPAISRSVTSSITRIPVAAGAASSADAVETRARAQEERAAGRRGRGHEAVAEPILGQHLERRARPRSPSSCRPR